MRSLEITPPRFPAVRLWPAAGGEFQGAKPRSYPGDPADALPCAPLLANYLGICMLSERFNKHLSLFGLPDTLGYRPVSLNLPTLNSSTKPDYQPMPASPEIYCKSCSVRYAHLLCSISIGHEPINSSPAAQIRLLSKWISHQIWWHNRLFGFARTR